MPTILHLWNSIPPLLRFCLLSTALKLAVDGLKASSPHFSGRTIHLLTVALSVCATFIGALASSGVNNDYVTLISQSLTAALIAIGVHEATKKTEPTATGGTA